MVRYRGAVISEFGLLAVSVLRVVPGTRSVPGTKEFSKLKEEK